MQVKIEIESDRQSMQSGAAAEAAIRALLPQVRVGGMVSGPVQDADGERVGRFRIEISRERCSKCSKPLADHGAAGQCISETQTGHVIGVEYRSDYWGFDYKVIGEPSPGLVEVELTSYGRYTGNPREIGSRWTHRTRRGKDQEITPAS